MARIDSFLKLVTEQHASDLHFHSGSTPVIRYHGELLPLPFRTLSRSETERFLMEILDAEQKETIVKTQELDFVYSIEGVARYRVNMLYQKYGMGAVFRVIPNRLPSMDELLMPYAVRKLTELQNGLVLVCGPTGSGKTTTLATMVAQINRTANRHVITIEDPIEFVHTSDQSVITQRQIGVHVPDFASALRSALRESPDVIIVGEMRDAETISLALSAAETGVLVFGTLHTNSSAKAIDRIIDAMPEDGREQVRGVLSVLLRAVISQQLCKKSNSDGRLAVFEVLLQNYAVSNMIRENKLHQLEGYLQSASNDGTGTQSLDHSLLRYVRQALVDVEEAVKVANFPDQLKKQSEEVLAE